MIKKTNLEKFTKSLANTEDLVLKLNDKTFNKNNVEKLHELMWASTNITGTLSKFITKIEDDDDCVES